MVTYYRHELVWPPFKGKAHKVVEISTGRGVGLYRTPEGARRKIAAMNREAAALNAAERSAS
jgi:putative methionine-R-sulfoxide reductase with GAF domain